VARLSRVAAFLLVALVVSPGAARAADAPASPDAIVGEDVRVERVKPLRPKLASMRFLRENRDFLRMRLDALRQSAVERGGAADAIDPRYLAYGAMKAAILAAADSVAAGRDGRSEFYADVADLGALDAELDRLERQLADQRARLGVLEADFTGRQATALLVVLRGAPAPGAALGELTLATEDGTIHRVPLSPGDLDALARGGRTQVFHAYVEPRAQTLAVTLAGAAGAGAPGYVTLDPTRDRITFLELDLSGVGASADGTALRARSWLHTTETLTTTR
jgi:hypothetical protein